MHDDTVSVHGETDARPERLIARYLNLRDEDRESLVNRVILSLARDIIEGRIEPGETFNSLELAKRFDTSRTPIREALIALERQGLIVVPPRRRPSVAIPTLKELTDVYELRAHLHGLVARKTAQLAGPDDIAALRVHLDAMTSSVAAGDVDGYFWANVEFHFQALEIVDDKALSRVLDSLGLQTLRLRRLGMSLPGRLERSNADHARLLLAYEDGDADLAASLHASIVRGALASLRESPHL